MGVFLLGIFVRKRGAIEMKNSADIRRDNKKSIYRFLLEDRGAVRTSRTMEQPEGERLRQYTKQEVAAATGLSPATCNTLLNDMERAGIVQGGRKKAGDVGRSSVLYRIMSIISRCISMWNMEKRSQYVHCSPPREMCGPGKRRRAICWITPGLWISFSG